MDNLSLTKDTATPIEEFDYLADRQMNPPKSFVDYFHGDDDKVKFFLGCTHLMFSRKLFTSFTSCHN